MNRRAVITHRPDRYGFVDLMLVYEASDGDATKALYDRLASLGPLGEVAVNLFRAHKSSGRAKVYRGGRPGQGSYRGMAYDRKEWSIENLAKILTEHAAQFDLTWGWGWDPAQDRHGVVLYVDLPTGQVSFHTGARQIGPDYPGKWDGVRGEGAQRICRWIAELFTTTPTTGTDAQCQTVPSSS